MSIIKSSLSRLIQLLSCSRVSHANKSAITYYTTSSGGPRNNKQQITEKSCHVDTLIIGGGPIGSSTAFHLAQLRSSNHGSSSNGKVVVLERDPTYKSSSATVSAGGIRQQFSLRENILMSRYGLDFLRNINTYLSTTEKGTSTILDVQFVEHGYLFLSSSEAGAMQMMENNKVQRDAGCTTTKLLTPNELREQFPWMNLDDIVMGSYGSSGEGWFDPWAYIQALKGKNRDLGVSYVQGDTICSDRDLESGRISSVTVRDTVNNEILTFHVDNVVNAAGAQADALMNLLAGKDKALEYPIPVKPRKRCIFFFHCSPSSDTLMPHIAPLTVDPSLVYFRSEGKGGNGTFLCGVSPPKEQDVDCFDPRDLEFVDHHLFDDIIWPALYHRVPAFGSIKVQSSWAGLYEYNTVDQNAIIDFHPEMKNVLMVNGFSGHGLQHSPAAGRAAAELLTNENKFLTLDLNIFRFNRLMNRGVPVFEKGIV